MSVLEYIADERSRLLVNGLVAGISFFVALFANRRVEEWNERRIFRFTLNAIRTEAKSNQIDYLEGFMPHYEDAIVLRRFGMTTVSRALADPLFVKHATPHQIDVLTEYLRRISLSNSYRDMAEKLRFNDSYFHAKSENQLSIGNRAWLWLGR